MSWHKTKYFFNKSFRLNNQIHFMPFRFVQAGGCDVVFIRPEWASMNSTLRNLVYGNSTSPAGAKRIVDKIEGFNFWLGAFRRGA
jgi:hypothetical protein